MVIPDTLSELVVPIETLRPYERNPRRGNLEAIKESLEAHGQYRPIVARTSGEVLAGNHTLQAALDLGWTQLAVTYVDVDDEQAARIVLVDNRTADLGLYDDGELTRLLESLPDLDGTAWRPLDLDRMLSRFERDSELLGADTDPGMVPEEPTTRTGDVWALGRHRLVCGDATEAASLASVLDGAEPEVLWTDPPYGVDYVGKTVEALTMTGDSRDGLQSVLHAAFSAADGVLVPGARFYCAAPVRDEPFRAALGEVGWVVHQTLVWVKDVFVLGHSDYHFQHEPIIYGWKPGLGRVGRGNHNGTRWYGDHAQSSVFAIDRPKRSLEHPTMKPVELIARQLSNSSRPGDAVLDSFAGSGSTLIACENLDRVGYAVEIDPGYCDVIVDRWERHTGGKAKRVNRRRARATA